MSNDGNLTDTLSAIEKEDLYVHKVYNDIATHFSQTRYKPWPIVEKYLSALTKGSIGLDIGCGNGKYLNVNKHVYIIGSDRSSELIKLAASEKEAAEVMTADGLTLPFRTQTFDFAISIAVIHHFSTQDRRIEAVKTILDLLRPGGTALIYVWALEQKNSRRGWDKGMDQDVFVPWVTRRKKTTKPEEHAEDGDAENSEVTVVKQRYYHLYKEGELEEDVRAVGGQVLENGYERDNWWAVISPVSVDF